MAIRVEDLIRIYDGLTAVDQVSCEIGEGETVGLFGHHGAGKPSITKMLTGYLEPGSGQMEVKGLDIETNRIAVRKLIGNPPLTGQG